jgi:hypothetical protein
MPSVAPLSFKSEFGYYNLRVHPTYEQVLGTVRKPLNVPLPERKAKWLALGPYRNYLEDAERAYNESIYNATDYRESGAHLPDSAARLRASMAAQDRIFEQIHRENDGMHEQDAYEAAFDLFNHEHAQQTEVSRRANLRQTHGSGSIHPTVHAEMDELDEVGVPHPAPLPRTASIATSWRIPPRQLAAAGRPQAPAFQDFRVLNMGDPATVRGSHLTVSQNMTYERMRDIAQPVQSF